MSPSDSLPFQLNATLLETLGELAQLWQQIEVLLSRLSLHVGSVNVSLLMVLKAIVVIATLQFMASRLLRRIERRLGRVQNMRASDRTLTIKIFSIVIYFVVFLLIAQVLGINLTALSVLGGALGVGLGFGLQKIASNFISGIILLFEKSIEINDVIELADGTDGIVRQTYARYTRIEAADGREILIPNEEFITQRVTTLTHTTRYARVEIKVSVAYDSDIPQVQQLMLAAANAHPLCLADPAANCFINNFGDSGIELVFYFWIADAAHGRIQPRSEVMLAVLQAFRAHTITIPYPQRELRVTNALPEGAAGAGA